MLNPEDYVFVFRPNDCADCHTYFVLGDRFEEVEEAVRLKMIQVDHHDLEVYDNGGYDPVERVVYGDVSFV